MQIRKKAVSLAFAAILLTPFTQAFADFNPNKLIDDRTFSDTQTFGSAAGIQQFLESKRSVLANTSQDFLLKLHEPQDSSVKNNLGDPNPNLGRLRTAAELIWDSAQKTGINPQVILVTLQKEQSLITGDFSSNGRNLQRALDIAMGFGCPDSGGCDAVFVGFYSQLFGGFDAQGNRYIGAPGSLMRSFNTPGGRGPAIDAQNQTFGTPKVRTSRINDTVTFNNTTGSYTNEPTQAVTLQNASTAALYRYTPHVYNGNYNFWRYFDQWFRYPNGTLIKLASDNTTYIINNGLRSVIPNFVIQARGLNPASSVIVSPTELSTIDAGPMVGPADNTIIRVSTDPSNKLFVFDKDKKHPVSQFVLKQRGLNPANALVVSQSDADLFATADLLVPNDGTLIRGDASKTVYVISDEKRQVLSAFTFKQYGYSFKNVAVLPQDEVDQYALGGFLLPKNGTLVKFSDTPTVYLLEDKMLKPFSLTVFKLRKLSFSNIAVLSRGELAQANLGTFVTPPEGTWIRTSDGAIYLYKGGTKHPLSAFVYSQRKPSFVALSFEEAAMINNGLPVAPKDGTLIKGDKSDAIYAIKNGLKVILDYNTWVKTYRKAKPAVLSQAEVDSYPAEGDIEQQ